MNSPDLSVIIPTCDRKDMLRKAILALYNQEAPPEHFEIVVIDDGKVKDAHEVIQAIQKEKGVRNLSCYPGRTMGPAAARNDGVRHASGKIILFIGDDILAHSRLLSEHMNAHRERDIPNLAVLGPAYWPPGDQRSRFLAFLMAGDQFGYSFIQDPSNVPYNFFYTSNISIHRDFMLENGGFDEDFPTPAWEDIELGYRLKQKGLEFIYRENAVAYHHHKTDLAAFCKRRYMIGVTASIFYEKHPEEGEMLMLDRMPARPGWLKKGFYTLLEKSFISLENRKLSGLVPGRIFYPCLRLISNYNYYRGLRESIGPAGKDLE